MSVSSVARTGMLSATAVTRTCCVMLQPV